MNRIFKAVLALTLLATGFIQAIPISRLTEIQVKNLDERKQEEIILSIVNSDYIVRITKNGMAVIQPPFDLTNKLQDASSFMNVSIPSKNRSYDIQYRPYTSYGEFKPTLSILDRKREWAIGRFKEVDTISPSQVIDGDVKLIYDGSKNAEEALKFAR